MLRIDNTFDYLLMDCTSPSHALNIFQASAVPQKMLGYIFLDVGEPYYAQLVENLQKYKLFNVLLLLAIYELSQKVFFIVPILNGKLEQFR